MRIQKLTITGDELNSAVGLFLSARGISIPVESVEKDYAGGGWRVELKDPEPVTTPITPEAASHE